MFSQGNMFAKRLFYDTCSPLLISSMSFIGINSLIIIKKRYLLNLKGKLEAAVVIKYHNYIKKMQIMIDNKNRNRFMRMSDKNVLHFRYNSITQEKHMRLKIANPILFMKEIKESVC